MDSLFYVQDDAGISNEVKKYIREWEKEIRNKGAPKTIYQKIQKDKNWYKIHLIDSKGIIFSYFVRNDMKFVMNNSECLVRDNFYIIKPKIDAYLMLALLNNYFIYYQLEKRGKKYGAGLLKLQRYDMEALMFPDIHLLSDEDKGRLADAAKALVDTGDKSNIRKITEIIAPHAEVSLARIMDLYEGIRKFRLGEKGNGSECS